MVTAARGAESRSTVTHAIAVASRADITAIGATELANVLRFIPGLSVEGTAREGGGPTSLFSRGGDSDYNVVLIDGVRVNLDGGRFDFGRVAAGEIDRVEVLRGAQSALWGSDAMGAVVQIFTKQSAAPEAPQLSGSIEGGAFDTVRGDSGINGGGRGPVGYRAGAAYRRTNGAFADTLTEPDRYEQWALDAGVNAGLGARAALRSGVRYSRGSGRLPGPLTYGSRDSGGLYRTTDASWHATLAHTLGARISATATATYFHYRSVTADRTVDLPFTTRAILAGTPDAIFPNGTRLVRLIGAGEFDRIVAAGGLPARGQFLASRVTTDAAFESPAAFRRPGIRYQADYAWGAGQSLTAGYDWERETNPAVAGFDLDNHALFVQQRSALGDRWFVTLGARVDRKERYGAFVSPKLSAGGFLVPLRRGAVSSLKLFGNLGAGVKTATFAERFGGPFADPSPGINVERARSGDLGVEATLLDQRLRALLVYFRNDFVDQISFRPGLVGDGVPEFINIDGSTARGWEVELALQRGVAGLTAAATYAFVDTEVVTNQSTSQQFQPGQPLLRRPRHSGTIRASYARGRLTVNAHARMIGDRHDNSFLSLRTIASAERPLPFTTDITLNPGYAVVGAGVDVRVHDALTVFVRGDNLGDTRYDSALGYPGLPRAVVAGARVVIGRRR